MSGAAIDRQWPHQVALPESVALANYAAIRVFCEPLRIAPRGHAVFVERAWFQIYCFARDVDAEAFRCRFGGEPFDPRDRGRGSRWAHWDKGQAARADALGRRRGR